LGEFDLELAFAGAGAGSENIEDELGTIENFDGEFVFEIALLGGGKFAVEQDHGGMGGGNGGAELVEFTGADERGLVGLIAGLEDGGGDSGAGAFGEDDKFG
jgi:hypothetical protein